MGVVAVAISIVTIWIWWPHGGIGLAVAIAVGLAGFWSYGIIHNHAMQEAKDEPGFTGDFFDEALPKTKLPPKFLISINMGATVSQVVILLLGLTRDNWWQALPSIIILSVILAIRPHLLVTIRNFVIGIFLLLMLAALVRACDDDAFGRDHTSRQVAAPREK